MNYLIEVYGRIYWISTSFWSWFFWFIIIVIIGSILVLIESKYKNQMTYYFIIFAIGSFILRIILWLFLPSPELFGVVK